MYRYLIAGLAVAAFLLSLVTYLEHGQSASAALTTTPGQAVAGLDVDCYTPKIIKSFNLINANGITLTSSGQGSVPCTVVFPFKLKNRYIAATAFTGIYAYSVLVNVRSDQRTVEIWFGETGTGRANLLVY